MAATRTTRNPNQVPLPLEAPAKICAVGVGGGGCNAIMRMLQARTVPGVRFLCVNTDIKSLQQVSEAHTIQIGGSLTKGLGAGGNPDVGAQAATSGRTQLKKALRGADLVFLTAGMGGGTGTGATAVVADIARETGAMVVAVATTPFAFEGTRRLETAMVGINRLREHVDNIIVIHNDRLLGLTKEDTSMDAALRMADEAVMLGILSVAEVVNLPGEINVDLADVKSIMQLPGQALIAIGESTSGGPLAAARNALSNPLLDISIEGAKGVLFNVNGGPAMTLGEVNATGELISLQVDPAAMIFFGMVNNQEPTETSRVTLIATGIPDGGTSFIEGGLSHRAQTGSTPDQNLDLDLPPFLRRTTAR